MGEKDVATRRYLLPLARTLAGALRGSPDHLAVYLDERSRYSDSVEEVRRGLHVELPILARRLQGSEEQGFLEQLISLHAPLLQEANPTSRVLFVGDCLFVEVRAFLLASLRAEGVSAAVDHVFFSARQNREDVVAGTTTAVSERRPDVVGISLFTFDAIPLFKAGMYDNATPLRAPDLSLVPMLVSSLADEIKAVRTASDATIVVHAPSGIPLDRIRRRIPALVPAHSRGQRRFLEAVRGEVSRLVDATDNALLLDEYAVIGGRARAFGKSLFRRREVPDGYFHTTRLGRALAGEYTRVMRAYRALGRAKAVFVDFDNTLWVGVMGEGPVQHDKSAQRLLKELKEAGVLLIALSKNDESSIRWDEMELEPDDFVLRKINWSPKPDNVSSAIAELDLAADAFVLIDDNPVERSLVTQAEPGVRSMDPADPETWSQLRMWLQFPSTKRTAEAARRTEMYREAAARRAVVGGASDYPTMMRSLRLVCTVRPAVEGDLERLLELVQRTNQFNTTTIRRSADEIRGLLASRIHGLWIATLSDRFGDLGVVALGIFDRRERVVDSFIMSCRAMGFGVETALLRVMIDHESRDLDDPVLARFWRTERNGPASGLFRHSGFELQGEDTWVLQRPRDCLRPPDWLEVEVVGSHE